MHSQGCSIYRRDGAVIYQNLIMTIQNSGGGGGGGVMTNNKAGGGGGGGRVMASQNLGMRRGSHKVEHVRSEMGIGGGGIWTRGSGTRR